MRNSPFYLVFIFSILTSPLQASDCEQARELINKLTSNHLVYSNYDSLLLQRTKSNFMNGLDPYSLFFTKEAIDKVNFHVEHDMISDACKMQNGLSDLYLKCIESVLTILISLEYHHTDKFILIDLSKFESDQYPINQVDQADKWARLMKYKAMESLFSFDSLGSTVNQELKIENRFNVLVEKEINRLQLVLNSEKSQNRIFYNLFMNAIAESFDPHTVYFSNFQRLMFENALSKETLSFGFSILEDSFGNYYIQKISPGGPAWKNGRMNPGDELLKVKIDDEFVYCQDISRLQLYQYIFGEQSNQGTFVFKKKDSSIEEINLKKENLENIENKVEAILLEDKTVVAYLSLPTFYVDYENQSALGCANDIAKQLLKLKYEGIDGVILDLRNNPGGSMKEAMDLIGIFINAGNLFAAKEKNGFLQIQKDKNIGSIYDGPLLVMVNQFSASASELVSATLQDYQRAIIFGQTTFGKSTGQIILPIASKTSVNSNFINVTMSEFYRVTGKTYQGNGVIPDIIFSIDEYKKEADLKYAIRSESLDRAIHFKAYPSLPIKFLQDKSSDRKAQNTFLHLIDSLKEKKAQLISSNTIALDEDIYFRNMENNVALDSLILKTKSNTSIRFSIKTEESNINDGVKDFNSHVALQHDFELNEALMIIQDLISTQN